MAQLTPDFASFEAGWARGENQLVLRVLLPIWIRRFRFT
jgi:hypothetical protein